MVFAFDANSCHRAVLHVRHGAPGVPIRLFSLAEPLPETVPLCQTVDVSRHSLALLSRAIRQSWQCWIALGVTTWTGRRGNGMLKLAPFCLPPFHTLIQNENGDFFAGTPAFILRHCRRRFRRRFRDAAQRVGDLARGYGLLLASLVLRILSLVFGLVRDRRRRRLFPYMKPGESLPAPLAVAAHGDILRFCQDGSYWSGSALDQVLRRSPAGLLLWREDGQQAEEVEDLLPLFEDARTFAVSRQFHFCGWKPLLFPTAPFRALQPGERSRVVAPLSSLILVDTCKLLALGVPRCSLAGAAWMILFWKAAAAGWRSYSVGQSGPVSEQPDLPVQETSFRSHLFFHRALRRLGPREPDLCRGNIAFAAAKPGSRDREPGRLKVLLVSPFLPYPLSHGGAVRVYNLCRSLRDRVDFVLAAVREQHDIVPYDKLQEIFREVYVVDKDELPFGDERLPEQVREHESRSLRALVAELAHTWKPDVLQIEYTHLARLRDAAPEIPAILVEHDLTFQLYRQLAQQPDSGARLQLEYQRWLDFERHWLGAYDAVWTVSEEDRQSAIREGMRGPGDTFHIPNGVDIDRFVPCDEPTPAPEILYVGSFRHLPNIIGFENLREEVMPRLWKRYPEARLRVVAGPRHEEFRRRFARGGAPPVFDNRVQIHGFVEDLRPLYARASVVAVPLEVSAGTNIKVLEGMACGKAIVTTAIGCAGLNLVDGKDALIARDWAHFAECVGDLLSDEGLRSRVATAARCTAEERFGWQAIASSAYDSYQWLIRAKAAAADTGMERRNPLAPR